VSRVGATLGACRPSATSRAGALLVVVVTLATGAWFYPWPSLTQDETLLLVYPDLVNRGRWPNRDFFTPYGPGTFWPLSALYRVGGGPSVLLERTAGLTYHVLIALAVWMLARRRGQGIAVFAGCAAGCIASGLQLVAYAWLLAICCLLWAVVAGSHRRYAASGALFSLACTVRPDMLVVAAVVGLCLVWGQGIARRFMAGAALGLLPLILHVSVVGTALGRNVFLDRVGLGTRLPLSSRALDLQLALVVITACSLLLVVVALRRRDRLDTAVALLSMGILPQAIQRLDRVHLLFVAVAVVPLGLAVLLDVIRRRLNVEVPGLGARGLVAVSVIVALLGGGLAWTGPSGYPVRVGDRTMYAASSSVAAQLAQVGGVLRELQPTDGSILVGTTDNSRFGITPTYLYFLIPDRVPDAYYLEMAPGVSEREGSRLLGDFRGARTLVLWPADAAFSRRLYPYLPPGSTRVNEYVRKHFSLVDTVSGFEIYRRDGN
jgi:hypothetical protein